MNLGTAIQKLPDHIDVAQCDFAWIENGTEGAIYPYRGDELVLPLLCFELPRPMTENEFDALDWRTLAAQISLVGKAANDPIAFAAASEHFTHTLEAVELDLRAGGRMSEDEIEAALDEATTTALGERDAMLVEIAAGLRDYNLKRRTVH